MVKHFRSNVTPPSLPETDIRNPLAFAQLPPAVQDVVKAFSGDGNALAVAVLSRISHYDQQTQAQIERDLLSAFGYTTEK